MTVAVALTCLMIQLVLAWGLSTPVLGFLYSIGVPRVAAQFLFCGGTSWPVFIFMAWAFRLFARSRQDTLRQLDAPAQLKPPPRLVPRGSEPRLLAEHERPLGRERPRALRAQRRTWSARAIRRQQPELLRAPAGLCDRARGLCRRPLRPPLKMASLGHVSRARQGQELTIDRSGDRPALPLSLYLEREEFILRL